MSARSRLRLPLAIGALTVLALCAAPRLSAQDGPAPDGGNAATLTVDLGGAVPVADSFDGLWGMMPGGLVRVATPFYGGDAHLGIHGWFNEGNGTDRPEFVAIHAQGGWGYPIALPGRLRLTPGAEVGALHMRFDDEDRFILALKNETELTAGVFVRLEAPVRGRVRAFVMAEAVRMYTFERIDLGFVHAGLSTTVASPSWFKRLLR